MSRKKFCLRVHYNGANSYLFVNATEVLKFKAKESKVNAIPLCLGNISKDFFADNMKKTKIYGSVYGFSIDYDAITVDILGIHNYLIKGHGII